MKTATDFMQLAINLALDNVRTQQGGPFGAVVVREGEVIAQGVNRVVNNNDPTAHAEIMAIRAACQQLGHFQLTDCELYTSCEPCPMCLGAIYWARPARVFYAATRIDAAAIQFDDAFIYQELACSPHHRSIPCQQLLREEALKVFEAWQACNAKTRY